jgi:glucokinase
MELKHIFMATDYSKKILGFDIGGTNIRVGVVQDKKISKIEIEKIEDKNNKESVLNQLYGVIEKVWTEDIVAFGIGVPGIVDVENGIIYDVVNIPSWKEVHLKSLLEKRYNRPVFINNDANCFALGEKYYGKAIAANSMVGLITGTGMGAGLVLNNRLYSGRNCAAGELGLISYLDHNYEYYCAGGFFEATWGVSAFETFQKCEQNDPSALERMKIYGKHLSEAVKLVLYAYDVDTIILGGSVSKAFEFYSDSLWENLNKIVLFKKQLEDLIIAPSELENSAILGAASLYYDSTL